jgi:hypothetical protein
LQCGFDTTTGKAPVPAGAAAEPEPVAESALSGSLLLLRGTAVSALGAILGAVVWAIVAVMTGLEIGWIAIGVGAAAGGGMAAGYDDKRDGTIPGIIAAFMALGGIVMGKVFIVIWVLIPLMTVNLDGTEFKRQMLAASMTAEALEMRGINANNVGELAWDKAYQEQYQAAMDSLDGLSDEQIDLRLEEIGAKLQAKIEVAAQQDPPQPDEQADLAADETVEQPDAVQVEVFEPEEEAPSLVGLFFQTMFGPIDGLFILFAFFTAYKLGSGMTSD